MAITMDGNVITGLSLKSADGTTVNKTLIETGCAFSADDYGAVADGTTDCTTALQSAIDAAYNAGGGTISFGPGRYVVSQLVLKPRVSIRGQGNAATVIMRKSSTPATTPNSIILIPIYSTGNAISDLTVAGGDMSAWTSGDMHMQEQAVGTRTISGVNGIHFYNGGNDKYYSDSTGDYYAPTTGSKYGAWNTYINGASKWHSFGSNTAGYKFTTSDIVRYKTSFVGNVNVIGCTGCALKMDQYVFDIKVNNCVFSFSGVGVMCESSDVFMDTIMCEGNAYSGFLGTCGNAKLANFKVIWNGCHTHYGSRQNAFIDGLLRPSNSFGSTDRTDLRETYAFQFNGSRSSIANLEVQDNWCSGIMFRGDDVVATGLMEDSNGMSVGSSTNGWTGNEAPGDCTGIYINGNRHYVQCNSANYKKEKRGRILKYALLLSYARYCKIVWGCQDTTSQSDCAYDYVTKAASPHTPMGAVKAISVESDSVTNKTTINGTYVYAIS